MKIIDEYKEEKNKQSKLNRKKSKKLIKSGRNVENKFALNSDNIEDIFDLLEKEHPEL